jgi:hypothetical protein
VQFHRDHWTLLHQNCVWPGHEDCVWPSEPIIHRPERARSSPNNARFGREVVEASRAPFDRRV